jgi:hypothetical protein
MCTWAWLGAVLTELTSIGGRVCARCSVGILMTSFSAVAMGEPAVAVLLRGLSGKQQQVQGCVHFATEYDYFRPWCTVFAVWTGRLKESPTWSTLAINITDKAFIEGYIIIAQLAILLSK